MDWMFEFFVLSCENCEDEECKKQGRKVRHKIVEKGQPTEGFRATGRGRNAEDAQLIDKNRWHWELH